MIESPVLQNGRFWWRPSVAGFARLLTTDVADNDWWISSPIENLTLDEVQQRATELLDSRKAASNSTQELISRKN